MDKIKFAVLGAGYIGKRHMEMIRNNPECELVAACDLKTREELNISDPELPLYRSPEELFTAHPDIDVACITTPNGLHAQHALIALDQGKHVVIEKPIALTKADCESIIFKALHRHKQVFCVMQNRYSPPPVWLKELIESGKLGKIFFVEVNCYWNRDQRYYKKGGWKGSRDMDGGTLYTQFSHFIDLMYWLFGDITNIQARFVNNNHDGLIDFEDSGVISFDFTAGGMGCFTYSTSIWDKNFESTVTIVAENGTVKVGGQYVNEVEYCHVKDYVMPTLSEGNPANDYGTYKGSAANHHHVFENVVDVIKGRSAITTNALEGMKVVDIIERIYALKPEGL
jgi:predicted dehydrogenase